MTIRNSLRILPQPSSYNPEVPEIRPSHIGSSGWIIDYCVPLMKWVVDAANAREMGTVPDPIGVAAPDSLPVDVSQDKALSKYILELCTLEVLSDELKSLKHEFNETNKRGSISSIQMDCAEQFQLSVIILFSELLACDSRVRGLGESAVDLLEYCMRKVRHTCRA